MINNTDKTDSEHGEIFQLLGQYFDGLYFGNTHKLASVFHPQAQYICACDEETLLLDMPTYFEKVKARQSPAKVGQQRRDRIVFIDIAGPETAFAKVNCAIGGRYFTDFLSLINEQQQWKIIAKVFHYDLLVSPIQGN